MYVTSYESNGACAQKCLFIRETQALLPQNMSRTPPGLNGGGACGATIACPPSLSMPFGDLPLPTPILVPLPFPFVPAFICIRLCSSSTR